MAFPHPNNLRPEHDALLDCDEHLKIVQENVRDYAVFTLDLAGRIAGWTEGAERLFGYTTAEALGESGEIVFSAEDRAARKMQAEMSEVQSFGRAERESWRMRKDGSRFWARGILTALRNEDGSLRGYAKILRDATEHRVQQDRLMQIMESISDAFFTLDDQWRFTFINASGETLLRKSRSEVLGKCIWEEYPEAIGSIFDRQYRLAASERRTITFEEYSERQRAWLSVRVYPTGEGVSVFFQNISARKQEELRTARSVKHTAFAADVGIALNCNETLSKSLQACSEAMVLHLNAAFARVWTLNAEANVLELQASAGLYTHLDGPHSRVPVGMFKIGLIAEERSPHLTNEVIGDVRVSDQEWAEREGMTAFAGYPLIAGDEVVGVVAMFSREAIAEDTLTAISLVADTLAQTIQRKRSEDALARSEELLQTTLRSIGDGVLTVNADMRIRFINPVAEALTGWSLADAFGEDAEHVFRIINESTREKVESPLQRAIDEGVIVGLANHTILISRDGTERIVEDSGAPIYDASGSVVGAVLVFRDATERRQSELEIQALNVRLQRAMTETHHRVKNNLQLISALIGMQQSSGAEMVPMSEFARLGSNVQALAIIHDILTQEAKDGSDQETLSAKAVLERLLQVLSQTTGGRRLACTLDDAKLVGRQTTTLALVTNELVSNALKHGKGEIEISFKVDGDSAILEVCDDGEGFPAGFNAQTASNTGLELIESIVSWDLRGRIEYENRTDGGARIAVAFPISAARSSQSAQ